MTGLCAVAGDDLEFFRNGLWKSEVSSSNSSVTQRDVQNGAEICHDPPKNVKKPEKLSSRFWRFFSESFPFSPVGSSQKFHLALNLRSAVGLGGRPSESDAN